jgi:DNA-binding Lrp family transcriptional regulator
MFKINQKEKKIIYELSKDARQSASKIAKKVGISKDSAIYTVNSLIKSSKIERLITLINTEALGFNRYEVFLQIRDSEKEIIKFLTEHPMFLWVRSALGEWEILGEFYAKDVNEYNSILREITNKFSKQIKKMESVVVLDEYSFPLKCIGRKEETLLNSKKQIKKVKIDDKDLLILKKLANDARVNVIDIAKEIKISSDSVIYRIKNLTKNNIILGYGISINETFLGLEKYKLIIKLNDIDDKTWKQLLTFLESHKATQYIKRTVGQWDLSITLLAKSQDDLRKIIIDIKNNLRDALNEYKIILLYKEYKNTYFPKGIK